MPVHKARQLEAVPFDVKPVRVKVGPPLYCDNAHQLRLVRSYRAPSRCCFDEAHTLIHDPLSLRIRRSASVGQDLLRQGLLDMKYAEQRKDTY